MTKHSYHKLRTENPPEYWRLRWQTYKKTHNKQKEAIAEILENLIKTNHRKENHYTKDDVDKAIIQSRGVDKRTRDNWFNLLWKLEYLLQPCPSIFSINHEKIPELELACRLSPQLSRKQHRLKEFLG